MKIQPDRHILNNVVKAVAAIYAELPTAPVRSNILPLR